MGIARHANGKTVDAGGELTFSFEHENGSGIDGQIKSDSQYDIEARWQDGAGNVIRTETVASNVAGGTWTDVNLNPKSAYVTIAVNNDAASQATVDATLHYHG